jgi:hypothetical protein
MQLDRRQLIKAGSAALIAGQIPADVARSAAGANAYKHRIAFGAWVNDMRNDPLPFQNWPAPQLDDETVQSIIQALDLQSKSGYNMLDVAGLDFLAEGWDPNIGSSLPPERSRRVKEIIKATHDRGMKIQYIFGTYSWGFNKLIAADPALAGTLPKAKGGGKSKVAMCDANPEAFRWITRILDYLLSEFDFDAVHLESADQGYCACPECAGKESSTEYNTRIVGKTADYIKSKWPKTFLSAITLGWIGHNDRFSPQDQEHVIALSKKVDCIFDQGHKQSFMIAEADRKEFIKRLHCDYGTSGGLWPYHSVRWDRESYFLPTVQRQGAALKKQFAQGVTGCMYYQGPMKNPAVEVNTACGGKILSDTTRDPHDVLLEVLDGLYKPKARSSESLKRLASVFTTAEDAYFSQWKEEAFRKHWGTAMSGEFYLDNLFGDVPGPVGYMLYPQYLDKEGRLGYRQGLVNALKQLESVRHDFVETERVERIRRCLIISLTILQTILVAKGEA